MKLKYVAITGADDDVAVADLNALSEKFSFAEWAILLMPERMGQKRFPSADWIKNFVRKYEGEYKSMHLCGSAFLGFIKNDPAVLNLMKGFNRIQLNLEFGNVEGQYKIDDLLRQIKAHPEFEFVIQYTDKRQDLLPRLLDIPNHAILFDGSAGSGVLPGSWPAPLSGHFCGYAGGLNPDNIRQNLEKIAKVAHGRETWVDMETGVRTDDRFDLKKVRRVFDLSVPFAA